MTLRPSYLRAAAVTYLWIGVLAAVSCALNLARNAPADSGELLSMFLIGGSFMAGGVCVMFVPRELKYDAHGFSCRMMVQGTHEFSWDELVAYGSGNNVFLLKFEGHQALQISGFGFRRDEWKEFKGFLKETFPEKGCRFWIGPMPIKWKR